MLKEEEIDLEDVFMGITKDFRAGGVRMHPARVVECRTERLGDMSEDSFAREGGTRYWPNRAAYIEMMRLNETNSLPVGNITATASPAPQPRSTRPAATASASMRSLAYVRWVAVPWGDSIVAGYEGST